MKLKLKLNLRSARLIIIVSLLVIVSGWSGFWLGTHQFQIDFSQKTSVKIDRKIPPDKQDVDFALFWDVWDRLEKDYLEKEDINPAQMVFGAIQGMVASLGDPYTVFLKPPENKEVKDDLNGSFEGVGIQLGYKDDQLAVIAPLKGTPADKAGVKAGDLILKINEESVSGLSADEAAQKIRGPKGSTVKLTLIHSGEKESYEVGIIRETIIVSSVEVDFLSSNGQTVAHLKLLKFGDRTAEEWGKAVNQIIDHQPQVAGVVLDLRNNPGGYLTGSVFIASEFLSSGIIVQQEQASGFKETYSVDRQGKLLTQPLVVLINEGSASASEIVAGSLRDHQRAEIVGAKSFGKGTIQEAEDLAGGAGLHITTARWLLPSGESINEVGLKPDVEVKDDSQTEIDEQLEKAIEVL
ncbi:peptidase S41 [Candidatus Woesebacteria bacterium CG_4_10_14_0_2_um_filter_39_14]|uniref:Peptidase S41 n=3 Tax=Microgenomates group TaxID=1794810 RepID=A0A2M6YPZ1_9BACT|nr:MAG: peptidase S41 [Candidatus Shapirobacteria bacterium CG07_land_8_20_14_0_80_39_12]PIZ49685.1 MAG: peptidase S41 [Candidatus Woesebacteria bacterium CG_4_10_14_0_2_um_filter_39_14]PJA50004.1 MAG: peptidase S41 [Candidatus Shapirobacteria bacterium CG_4_9_14_3_um_filter_39_13]